MAFSTSLAKTSMATPWCEFWATEMLFFIVACAEAGSGARKAIRDARAKAASFGLGFFMKWVSERGCEALHRADLRF